MCAESRPRANKYNKSTTLKRLRQILWRSHLPCVSSVYPLQSHRLTTPLQIHQWESARLIERGKVISICQTPRKAERVCFWLIWRGCGRVLFGGRCALRSVRWRMCLDMRGENLWPCCYGPNRPDRLSWKLLSMFRFKSVY